MFAGLHEHVASDANDEVGRLPKHVATIVDIDTRISDLYSPFDQIAEQIRLTIETVKERQECGLINNDADSFCSPSPTPVSASPPSPDRPRRTTLTS